MKTDLLAFGAHPDDVELSCGGTLMVEIAKGKSCGIVDLTRGELGTRGTAETRAKESEVASKILGVSLRENLGMADGFFQNDKEHQLEIIRVLRRFQPDVVLANAQDDRHPDHPRAASLIADSCFLSGLKKVSTIDNGVVQQAWRPRLLLHYIQDNNSTPDFVVDISSFAEKKLGAIKAYSSQFYNPESNESETYIAQKNFLDSLMARCQRWGRYIGVDYAEGFTSSKILGVKSVSELL